MQTLTAKDAKYGFGRLIDLARAAPVAVAKHGRAVVVVMAIEEHERLKLLDGNPQSPRSSSRRSASEGGAEMKLLRNTGADRVIDVVRPWLRAQENADDDC